MSFGEVHTSNTYIDKSLALNTLISTLQCNSINFIHMINDILENVKYLDFDKSIDRLYKFENNILILPNSRDRFKLISTTSSNWLSKLASFRSSSH